MLVAAVTCHPRAVEVARTGSSRVDAPGGGRAGQRLVAVDQPGGRRGLLVYLAVPPTVAGLRHGWVQLLNTTLACALPSLLVWSVGSASDASLERRPGRCSGWASASVPASSPRGRRAPSASSSRAQAPLTRGAPAARAAARPGAVDGQVGLDSSGASELLGAAPQAGGRHPRSGLQPRDGDRPLRAGRTARSTGLAEARRGANRPGGRDVLVPRPPGRVRRPAGRRRRARRPALLAAAIPARPPRRSPTSSPCGSTRPSSSTTYARLATEEERHRIAREMHDGVAQELVALGYAVDEIASVTDGARDQGAGDGAAQRDHPRRLRAPLLHLRPAARPRRPPPVDRPRRLRQRRSTQDIGSAGPPHARRGGAPAVVTHPDRDPPRRAGGHRQRPQARARRQPVGHVVHRRSPHSCSRSRTTASATPGPRSSTTASTPCSERAAGIGATLEVTDRPGGGTVVEPEQPTTRARPHEGDDHAHHRHAGR